MICEELDYAVAFFFRFRLTLCHVPVSCDNLDLVDHLRVCLPRNIYFDAGYRLFNRH